MSNKGAISNENIINTQKEEKIKVKNLENELHTDANELIKDCIGNPENPNLDKSTVLDIINKYKDHPSITKIKELCINKTS